VKAKLLARLQYFEEHWHELRRPYVDLIEDGIYELRVQFAKDKIRVIYAYMFKDYIVLLHSFIKTTAEIPEKDKLVAKKRMYDFQIQYNEGRINLKRLNKRGD
jgi:phage-related protein